MVSLLRNRKCIVHDIVIAILVRIVSSKSSSNDQTNAEAAQEVPTNDWAQEVQADVRTLDWEQEVRANGSALGLSLCFGTQPSCSRG